MAKTMLESLLVQKKAESETVKKYYDGLLKQVAALEKDIATQKPDKKVPTTKIVVKKTPAKKPKTTKKKA